MKIENLCFNLVHFTIVRPLGLAMDIPPLRESYGMHQFTLMEKFIQHVISDPRIDLAGLNRELFDFKVCLLLGQVKQEFNGAIPVEHEHLNLRVLGLELVQHSFLNHIDLVQELLALLKKHDVHIILKERLEHLLFGSFDQILFAAQGHER